MLNTPPRAFEGQPTLRLVAVMVVVVIKRVLEIPRRWVVVVATTAAAPAA
jgi:hypothetical protein